MIKNGSALLLAILACQTAPEHPESFQGVVELDETVLAFEIAGRIDRLDVREGELVTPSRVVAVLDDSLSRAARSARALEAEALRSEAELVRAGARREDIRALAARVRAARATETMLEKNLARQRALFEKNAVAPASVDDMEAQFERARAEREGLESQLASLELGARRQEREGARARAQAAEAALSIEDERLARHTLHAPGAGRVLDTHVEVGEVVAAGAPVVTLGDTRRPYVEVFVRQSELTGIDVGDSASIRVDAEEAAFRGTVEHISRRTEFTPRFLFSERERPNLVVRVRVRVEDPGERLHAGVPAFVEIARGSTNGARP